MKDSRHLAARLLLLCLLLALALPAAPPQRAAAAPPALPDPLSVTLVGDLQTELGCSSDWMPDCAATNLTLVGNGVWRGAFTVPAGSWSYKIALNGAWTESYPAGDRSLVAAAPTAVRFYYDNKNHAVLDSLNDAGGIAVAVGSFQSELGCPGDWAPGCVRSLMTDADGDGIFAFVTDALPPAAYELKVALDETWDVSHPAANVPFAITVAGQSVAVRWNPATNEVTASVESVVSAPDNNVEYNGLAHDSRSDRYRLPFGAVTPGTPVTLRFRTFHNDVTGVRARIYDSAAASQSFRQMTLAASDVSCAAPLIKTCDFWTTTVTPTQRGLLYYRFIATDGSASAFYEDDALLDGGLGEALPATQDRSYNIYVYDADFATPEWARNATIYQIFVERFRNGDAANDPTADPATDRGWFYPTERGHRFPITPWNSIVPDPEPYTDPSRPYWATYSSTMYGGDLIGVTQKISDGYFGSLGVTALYLNPIFDSPSNHKYDGRDYRSVDPAFGGKPAFDELISVAHAHGLKVILDGVPNHVSSDSPFFDRFGRYPTVGACESLASPYRSWFFFEPAVPAGTGACAGDTSYRGWFGVATLPQINTAHPEVLAYWFGTPGGRPELPSNTASYWVEQGADGWRIDVVPDVVGVNPAFFETWRDTMKATNPDSVLYSETWPEADVRERVLGDEFDSTMNYRYRKAVLGLLRETRWTDNDGGQEIDPLSPSQFVNAFETMREDYPKPAFDTAMNLIDSHDTNRAVHVLNEEGFTGAGYERQPADGFAAARQRLGQVAVLQMTLPGAPTIYYGDEVGLTGYGFDVPRDDPYNRQPYPWADEPGYASLPAWRQAQADLLANYQAAGRLRADHSFLRTGSFDVLRADDAAEVLAYGRRDATGAAIVVFNRGASARTVTLDLAGYVPAGAVLSGTLPLGGANLPPTSGATYDFALPAQGYGVWITPPGADLTPPPAPVTLNATPGNGVIGLSWSAAAGASRYHLYRSLLPGGGYELVADTSATAFNDTAVSNGRRYYYIVKAVDAAGNESQPSNEASATPAFPVNYAVLQFPKTIIHTAGVTPTALIYGQVFVGGITDVSGSPALIRAEIGFGPEGSNPAMWTGWQPMIFNAAVGNNYEYSGRLRPEQPGNFDMLVRFSTDGGLSWAYGDKDGFFPGEPGTDDPGDLTVAANPDTTPPAAPANLSVADWGDDFIALRWEAVGDAALYRLYRSVITGTFDFNAPLAEIGAPTLAYTDAAVASGVRYQYVVKAFDHAFNQSPPSNEVSQVAAPKLVTLIFNLTVPPGTPGVPTIAGNNAQAFGQAWNPGSAPLAPAGPNQWRYETTVLDGAALEYKYARGSWEKVEKQADGNAEVANRLLTVDYGAAGTQIVSDTIANWRDPFVLGHLPAAGATNVPLAAQVSARWNQAMPPAADFAVAGPSGPVSGTFAYDSGSSTTTWTPAAPLAPSATYTVTVAGELDVNNDVQQVPSVWSFRTVPALRSFNLTATAAERSAPAGGQAQHTLILTNTGNVADTYALSRTGGLWLASYPASVGPLAPGESATIQVTVSVPVTAANGASDALTISARSLGDPAATRALQLTTSNSSLRSFALTATAPERSGPAGGQAQHTLILTNTGNVAESYALGRSGGLWSASFPASAGPVAPGQSITIQVAVNVPSGAANGASDTLTIVASAQSNPALTQSAQLTTRNATRRLFLPLIQRPPLAGR